MNIDKNTPLVSVIIPTYKRPHMLKRAIESVISQTYTNIEIIIVDDNNDGDQFREETEEFMKNYAYEKRIIYLKHNFNKGGSEARNTGIKYSNGAYITFLDDDDEYCVEKINKQVKIFTTENNDNRGFVYCGMNYLNVDNEIVGKLGIYTSNSKELFEKQMIRGIIGTPMLMIPKQVFSKVGGFKTLKCGQDYELILRILAHGYSINFVPEELINVYVHDEQRISATKFDYIEYLMEIKREYLHLFDSYVQKKIWLEYDYAYYRLYCSKNEYKNALQKFFGMWMKCVWDVRLIYSPIFLILGNGRSQDKKM